MTLLELNLILNLVIITSIYSLSDKIVKDNRELRAEILELIKEYTN